VSSPFDLHGRCAVVTGAGRGIGRAVAVGLAQAGADVVLLGRPGAQDDTRDAVRSLGGSVDVVDLDVSDLDAVERVAAEVTAERQVDVLVNNAGIIDRADSVDVDRDAWQRVLDVNLNGLFFLCQQLGRPMVERGHGKIVSIASLLSFQGGLRVVSYAASKHGVAGVTKALANEWGPHGVQVNAIAPGWITDDDDLRPVDHQQHPVGRVGRPDDIAQAVLYLAGAGFVTGQVLSVDGGMTRKMIYAD